MRSRAMLLLILAVLLISGCQQPAARIHVSLDVIHVVAVHEGRYLLSEFADEECDSSQKATQEAFVARVESLRSHENWLAASRPINELENEPAFRRRDTKRSLVLMIAIGEASLPYAEKAADLLSAKGLAVARPEEAVSPCWQDDSTGPATQPSQ